VRQTGEREVEFPILHWNGIARVIAACLLLTCSPNRCRTTVFQFSQPWRSARLRVAPFGNPTTQCFESCGASPCSLPIGNLCLTSSALDPLPPAPCSRPPPCPSASSTTPSSHRRCWRGWPPRSSPCYPARRWRLSRQPSCCCRRHQAPPPLPLPPLLACPASPWGPCCAACRGACSPGWLPPPPTPPRRWHCWQVSRHSPPGGSHRRWPCMLAPADQLAASSMRSQHYSKT
jgi:hypothetical protein